MEKHTREVITIKRIASTVFILISLSMTIPSRISWQLKAAETVSDSDCGEITIGMDGAIVSDSPDCQAKFNISDKIYRLTENISFERSNGIVIKCSNIVLDLAGYVITTPTATGDEYAGILCTDVVSGVEIMNGTIEEFHYGVYVKQNSAQIKITNITLKKNLIGIRIAESHHIEVMDNELKESTLRTFELHRATDVEIANNNITSSSTSHRAFDVTYSTGISVTKNLVISRKGALVDESDFVRFANNNFIDCSTEGIVFENLARASGKCNVTNNVMLNSSKVIRLRGKMSKDVIISGNEIRNCEIYGIHIRKQAGNCQVFNNTITSTNGIGIHLLNTSNNNVFNNSLISNEGIAIKLEETGGTNVLLNNALNYSVGIDCTNSHDNSLIGNNATSSHLAGISLSSCTNTTVLSNIVDQSQKGICLSQSPSTRILKNYVTSNEQGIITNNSDNVTVSINLVLNSNGGISIQDSTNNTVSENTITLCARSGINCSKIRDSRIYNNTVTHQTNGECIAVFQGLNCSIFSNTVSNNTGRIWVGNSTQCVVQGNTVSNNVEGIWVGNSTQCVVQGNTVNNNTKWGICLSSGTSNNTIYNNTITLNAGLGGLWLDSSATSNNIIWNSFSWNEVGLCIRSGENVIYHNNFVNNTICQAECANLTCRWNNGYEGNYWSDYKGTEGDRAGIGKEEYAVGKGVNDSYPLMGFLLIFEAEYTFEVPFGLQLPVTKTFDVTLMSNATVVPGSVSFVLDPFPIRFNITQSVGATAFCKITLPEDLMRPSFTIRIDNEEVYTLDQGPLDPKHFWLRFPCYFNNKGNLSVEIDGDTSKLFLPEDVYRDGRVDVVDITIVAMAFGTKPGDPYWNESADLNNDKVVNIIDISTVGMQFGRIYVDPDV